MPTHNLTCFIVFHAFSHPPSDLGWYDSESYGITYKVRGFCKDSSNPEVFDAVSVRGDILRSHIHHLYFGHYSYGHEGGNFSYNEVSRRIFFA